MSAWDNVVMATKVVYPLLADLSRLAANMVEGARSLATATAELRSMLKVAYDRLDSAEAAWRERDREEDERVRKLSEETKP